MRTEKEIKEGIENDSKMMVGCMGCGERTGLTLERVLEDEVCNRCSHLSLMDMVSEQEEMESYFRQIKGKRGIEGVSDKEIAIYKEEVRIHKKEKEKGILELEIKLRQERLARLRRK